MDGQVLASLRTQDPLIDPRCPRDATNNGGRLATLKSYSLNMFRIVCRKSLRRDGDEITASSESKQDETIRRRIMSRTVEFPDVDVNVREWRVRGGV